MHILIYVMETLKLECISNLSRFWELRICIKILVPSVFLNAYGVAYIARSIETMGEHLVRMPSFTFKTLLLYHNWECQRL